MLSAEVFLSKINEHLQKLFEYQDFIYIKEKFSILKKDKLLSFLDKFKYLKESLNNNDLQFLYCSRTTAFCFGSNLILFNEDLGINLYFIYGLNQEGVVCNSSEYFIIKNDIKYNNELVSDDYYAIIKKCIQNNIEILFQSKFSDYFLFDFKQINMS